MTDAERKAAAAVATLERLGYTHTGGEQWKPTVGNAPNFYLADHCHWRAKAEELFAEGQALRAQMAAESARLEWCIGVLIALPGYLVTDTGCGCCGDQMRFDEKLDGRAAIDAAILARGA